jgi:hypothetical protein
MYKYRSPANQIEGTRNVYAASFYTATQLSPLLVVLTATSQEAEPSASFPFLLPD